jgi:hypothetical protein
MIKLNCLICNNEFKTYKSRINRGGGKYCSRNCYCISERGKDSWNKGTKGLTSANKTSFKKGHISVWKGGRTITSDGHVLIKNYTHPNRGKNNYMREHVLVAEKLLNRYLTKLEIIHHINSNKSDNSPENLYLFESRAEHNRYHMNIAWNNGKSDIITKSNIY